MEVCISPIQQVQMYLYFCIYSSLETVSWGSATGKVQNQIFKTNSTWEEHWTILCFFFRKGVRQAEEKASTIWVIRSSIMSQVQMWLHVQMYSCHACGGKATLPSRTLYFLKCLMLYSELEIVILERKGVHCWYITDSHREPVPNHWIGSSYSK